MAMVTMETILAQLEEEKKEERRLLKSFTHGYKKMENLQKVLNKYKETFKYTDKYNKTIHDIENQIIVLSEVFKGNLEADRWENQFKKDLEDYNSNLINK